MAARKTHQLSLRDDEDEVDYFDRRRAVAWTVDTLLVMGAAAGGASLVFGRTAADEGSVGDWLMTIQGLGVMLAIGFLYLGLLPSLGKFVVRFRVTRSDGGPP